MKITTLVENHVYNVGLFAENGLSILIDTGNKKILFDTGQSDVFIKYNSTLLDERVVFVQEITEIDAGIYIMPAITIYNDADTSLKEFKIIQADKFIEDTFEDELFLAIKKNDKISILSSCSHRGITNIIQTTLDYFKKKSVNLIEGGFHLKNSSAKQFETVSDYFKQLQPESIGICHCTGLDKYADLFYSLESKVFYNYTGNRVNL